jgi:hypothetical protein
MRKIGDYFCHCYFSCNNLLSSQVVYSTRICQAFANSTTPKTSQDTAQNKAKSSGAATLPNSIIINTTSSSSSSKINTNTNVFNIITSVAAATT